MPKKPTPEGVKQDLEIIYGCGAGSTILVHPATAHNEYY